MAAFKPTHTTSKTVEAHPIASAEFRADGSGKVALQGGVLVDVPAGFASRYAPSEGDMLIRYFDGYLSHCPADVFQRDAKPISREPDAVGAPAITLAEAQAIVETKPAPRITADGIKAAIDSAEYFRSRTLTICILTMSNGFHVIGKSACASPENYDQAVGERYAYDDAFRQIWAFEAYLLKEKLAAAEAKRRGSDDAVEAA